MASQSRLPPKKDVALALLEQSTVFVHLDPRSDDVRVPVGFKRQPQLVLQIGYNMAPPIPDLEVRDDGISCTLSFNRSPHFCWIPWAAVFALYDSKQRGMVWPDDVPREVTAQAAPSRAESKPTLRAVPAKEDPGVAAEVSAEADAASEPPKAEKPKKKRAKKAPAAKEDTREARKPARPLGSRASAAEAKAPARGTATAAGTAASGADKRRRALPPYLRVIK